MKYINGDLNFINVNFEKKILYHLFAFIDHFYSVLKVAVIIDLKIVLVKSLSYFN